MSINRRAFCRALATGAVVSLIPDMIVDEPLTVWGIKNIEHPIDPNASHIADVFLKHVNKGWEHHIFTVDIKAKPNDEGTGLVVDLDHQLSNILEGGHYIAGFGFQLNERKVIGGLA